ncbi:hypothetical protein KGQ34_01815 [Patescibacteria group bacterium]|nr:hypothetical protein [Patescibacteria group bacterium]
MARMSEKDALKNIVRFSDPRLHRVGFGIQLTIFNPKERTILIYRKGSYGGIDPGLSVIPLDELQPLTLDEFCVLGNCVINTVVNLLSSELPHNLRVLNGELEAQGRDARWYSVSIYDVISMMNWVIESLQQYISQKNIEQLVWSEITY